jgi:hypothetical protein
VKCPECSAEFRGKPYSKALCCSVSCALAIAERDRDAHAARASEIAARVTALETHIAARDRAIDAAATRIRELLAEQADLSEALMNACAVQVDLAMDLESNGAA